MGEIPGKTPPAHSFMHAFFRGRNEAVTAKLDQVSESASTHPPGLLPAATKGPLKATNGLEDGALQL